MSVGISQVNFDAQVLEDEEEAALEKEDQEREQEIRELLNSELDDGLLDDDNVSFSSHDLRSSGYSRDTPFSDDFSEHAPQTIFNGHDAKKIIPSERGAFERPPLITQRAFHVINGSGQGQDLNMNRINQPYSYDARHHYEDHYGNPGYYDSRGQGSPYNNGQVDGYEQSYDHSEGGANDYRTLPDDMDEGFDQYGNYYPPQETMQGQSPLLQDSHHYHPSQSNYPGSNFNEGNNSPGNHDFNEDYTGYNEEGFEGQNTYNNGAPSVNEQNHYRIDTPGNYRVQYHGQHEPFPHVSDRGSDRHTNEIANGFSEDGTRDIVQLQILYKARGRKLEELTQMLKNQEEEMTKEIRILNHQNAMMKDEHDGISASLENSQKMVQASNTELSNLKGQLAAAYQQINALKESKEEVVSKLHVTETTINSLNQQLVELSRSESLTRAKEQHESIVNAMKKKHEEQVVMLKQKLDEAILTRDCKHEEANQLRDELVEKAEMINSLTRSLDSSQKQCQEILKSGTMSEINQLRLALQESSTARNVAEGQCISLKHELSELQEQVKMYESASRLGVGLGSNIHNDSLPHLTVRNLNKENWSTPRSHKAPLEETVGELRRELEQCLVSNKAKREQVHELEKELGTLKDQLKDQEIKAQRMERIAQEHEDKSQELEKKIQELESNKTDPDEGYQKTLKDLELARRNLQETAANLEEAIQEREELSESCADLKQQMAQMVAEFDEDKRISIEKCREACLQLHEDAKNLLRDQLNQEHEQIVRDLKRDLEEHSEELIRIKECYVQLGEDSRGLEQKLREEFEKEKQMLLSESEAKLVDELQASLEKQYVEQLEKAQEQWKEEEIKRINDELLKQKEQLLKNMEEEKSRAVEEAVSKAWKEWITENSSRDNQSDIEDQIAAARREWIKNHNDELERRLSNAIQEVRRIWDEEQKLKTKEEIERVRAELELAHGESRDQRLNQAVELALSQAQADWLKNEEEIRQREIDQAVEVAITNAVAEAKVEWEKEIMAQDNLLQTSLAQERARWKKEEESVRNKAVEAAVAIAEVKWLEEEQKKISEAVEQAMQTARETWQEERKRDIAMAVDAARQEWTARKEDEVNRVLESASSQLVEQFEEQKKEALEKAIGEARLQWEKRLSQEKGLEIASLREEIFREFEEQKKAEILETLEEAKEAWIEESEEQKREEVNEAMAYLESEYTKSLEEFKHKTLKEALEQARKQWTTEELSHREEIVKARLAAAREDWRKDMAESSQVEIDRALSTAREAWAADHEKELEERVSQLEKDLKEQLEAKYDEEKKQLVDVTLREAEAKFKNERRKLEDELRRNNLDDSSRAKWQDERARLVEEHQNQLEHMRSECDSKLADQRAQIERDLGIRMNTELEKARNGWEKKQHDVRVQLEKQCEQKTRQAVENARRQWEKQQRQEINKSCDDAVKRQQEIWANETRENLSALEKLKHELASVKKEHATTVDKLKRELEERKKTQYSFKRRDSRDYATQTALQVDSGSDTSFSSVDHVSASRGLHELRQHYLDTIAKIRDDVLDHVNQTKASAAKKIRGEVLKERHSTAKKLRKYYLQCLKQLLEEDRVAMEGNSSPISAEEKINRMAEALRTVSPDKESHGQPSRQTEVDDGTQSHRSGVFNILRAASEPDIRDIKSPCAARFRGRPRDGGPDGASDTAPIAGKEREFTPILGKVTAMDGLEPGKKHFTPERDFGDSSGQRTDDRSVKAYNMVGSVPKRATVDNSEQDTSVALAEKERQRNYVMHERSLKQKPLGSNKRCAPSPAFSVKSYESDQYSELPTVIHVSRRESSGSKDSNSSITSHSAGAKDLTISPVTSSASDMRSRPSTPNRMTKLASRDKGMSSSPSLPSKPRIDVRMRRAQNSS